MSLCVALRRFALPQNEEEETNLEVNQFISSISFSCSQQKTANNQLLKLDLITNTQTSILPKEVQCAFKDLMTHRVLQFALPIAFRCVLHRFKSQDIHRD